MREQAKGTLNLAMITGYKASKLKVDPKRVPKTNMIHLHQGISDILYTDMLHTTLQIAKLTASKKRVEEMLWKEKVENKAYQTQIRKL